MEGLTVRPLLESDRAGIEGVARRSPEAARWLAESYAGYEGWVAESGSGGVAGFLVARVVEDELEILNLAVDPAERRRGTASILLKAAFEHGRRAGCRRVFLEVRESNQGARRFYERRGFAVAGRRPRYYRDPEEDALVMTLALL